MDEKKGKRKAIKQNGASATSSELSSESDKASAMSSELSSDGVLQTSYDGERNTKASKPKKCSVSMGTVSGVIGKEYVRPRPLTNEAREASKPIKIDSKELPVSEIWPEEIQPSMTSRNNTMHIDVEEFLFKMLGDGFQLDMNVIREVLGLCGYDMQKGMEKLLDLSASKLDKCDDVVGVAGEKSTEKCPERGSVLHQEHLKHLESAQSDGAGFMTRNLTELPKRNKDRFDLQKEVLEALFNVPERFGEATRRMHPVSEVRRSKAFGKVVVEPLRDTTSEHTTAAAEAQHVTTDEDEDDEDSYEVLRKAVKEYWVTMKEYYKAAVDAFAKGDYARADKLREQGHFFKAKAQEADEKSTQKLLETSCRDDEVSLDLHVLEPKDALRLLRLHLTSLSGIPSIMYLRIIVGINDEDPKGARRRLIMKLLERESIKWTEEGTGKTILIQMDVIDPKCLSFAKDK